ncbi:MAG: NADPH-dependent FMN reductase [Solirubrobacteraceae bacterium]
MRLLAVPGSLRSGSYNARLLRAATAALSPEVAVETWNGLAILPPFDEDAEHDPPLPAVETARSAIVRADAVLIATPEYNASIPGPLKNALDWASRPYATNVLRGKPVAVVGASPGLFGAVWAQADLRRVLAKIGADVLDTELAVPQADTAFDEAGRLRDCALGDALDDVVRELLDRVAARSTAAA